MKRHGKNPQLDRAGASLPIPCDGFMTSNSYLPALNRGSHRRHGRLPRLTEGMFRGHHQSSGPNRAGDSALRHVQPDCRSENRASWERGSGLRSVLGWCRGATRPHSKCASGTPAPRTHIGTSSSMKATRFVHFWVGCLRSVLPGGAQE